MWRNAFSTSCRAIHSDTWRLWPQKVDERLFYGIEIAADITLPDDDNLPPHLLKSG